ncbi:MAG: hypothetical protein ABFS38_01890 [Bacteroidota bacterium]
MTKLIIITILVLVLNIPFGYWRANVKQFSTQWFLAIHIPVPFIIALRFLTGIGFSWYTYLFLVGGFFLGQKCGSWLKNRVHMRCHQETSCLVMDIIRCARA